MGQKIPVSIQRCASYEPDQVQDALNKALAPLGGISSFVSPGDRVLLKPNLLSARPPEAAVTTHPEVVRAVALEVQAAGGTALLGDSPGAESLNRVLKRCGIMEVVRETGIEVLPFRTPEPMPVPEGGVYKSFLLASEAASCDAIINLPKFKTHGMMTMTLAVKNMFGAVVGAAKAGWHLQVREPALFGDMLLDIWRTLAPALNIMDGITAMEGNGPGSGDPLDLGLLMASPSSLAMDCVAGAIAGVDPGRHPVLYRAMMRSLRGSELSHVEVLGEAIRDVKRVFVLPVSASRVDFRLPAWLKGRMKRSLNCFPVLDAGKCTTCGQCAQICPVNAITLHNSSRGGGDVDRDLCISCFCCQEVCPERAIAIVPGGLLRVLRRANLA
ncbi:MAG: DUF362 domain-containing protein [bacterium]|nr:MAG: DUF362 domain-containing protein [bacterium]